MSKTTLTKNVIKQIIDESLDVRLVKFKQELGAEIVDIKDVVDNAISQQTEVLKVLMKSMVDGQQSLEIRIVKLETVTFG